ncbi:MAG TPA: hypothetical protein DIU15_02115 [Deltaproteobacteria bacterium]|nr:hypothetical protein [Deltaproteobacteria bacterium]HCP44814.1 hypothetical protein [Deltaproteobacteria bacterium]|tara:strand:- start:51 stop:893 length:843 start_codon:yes stop_codon:yes gene_type:complete
MRRIVKQKQRQCLAAVMFVASMGLLLVPSPAEAVSLNMINTWRMGDHLVEGNRRTSGGTGVTGGGVNGPAWDKGSFPSMGINVHFGVGVGRGDQIVPFLGFGMLRTSYVFDWDPNDDDNDPDIDDDTGAALQFGLEIGSKFFLIERAKGKAPPFILVSFYKYFGNISEDGEYETFALDTLDGEPDTDNAADYLYYEQELLSPQGFKVAFGAEYYFNDNFSLGGEFFGVDFSWARARNPSDMDLIDVRTRFAMYTSLHLTYRFSFTVRASVQFEDDYDYED